MRRANIILRTLKGVPKNLPFKKQFLFWKLYLAHPLPLVVAIDTSYRIDFINVSPNQMMIMMMYNILFLRLEVMMAK